MQYLKTIVSLVSLSVLFSSTLMAPLFAQSGRGRPKVPVREPAQPPPPPPQVPAAAALAKKEQVNNLSRFVLQNGLTVVISEQHSAPLAAAAACFKVGAFGENETTQGASRLLAKLLFGGSIGKAAERSTAALRALGGQANASAQFDKTTYQLLAPPDRLLDALALLADSFRAPTFDAEEMRRAAAILLEEDRSSRAAIEDDAVTRAENEFDFATALARKRLYQTAVNDNRLARAASLNESALRALTPEQLTEFYRANYRPENLTIAVAGDVLTFNTLVHLQQQFGNFGVVETSQPAPTVEATPPTQKANAQPTTKSKATPSPSTTPTKPTPTTSPTGSPTETKPDPQETPAAPEPEPPKLRYSSDRADSSDAIVSIGFHTPGWQAKEWAALEVLAAVLGKGRGSRLHGLLVDLQSLASEATADYLALNHAGFLSVQVRVLPTALDKAEPTLFREVDRLRRELVSEGELVRARMLLEKRFYERRAHYADWAAMLADAEATTGSFRAAFDYVKTLRTVQAEDVQRVAAQYFIPTNTVVYELLPLNAPARTFDAAGFAQTITAWAPEFGKPIEAKAIRTVDKAAQVPVIAQGAEPTATELAALESLEALPVKDFSTYNGPRAFVREDRSLPIVTTALLFQGGRVAEEEATSGATELMLRAMLFGTQRKSAAQVTQELEQLGTEVAIVNEPDLFGFVVSGLSRNAERALRLVRDIIEEPAFKEDDVESARAAQLGRMRRNRDDGFARARELMLQSLYPTHPYTFPAHGKEEAVTKLTLEQITQWHERWIKRQLPLIVIVGDTQGSALISGQLAEGFRRRDVEQTLKLRVPQPAKPAEKIESRQRPLSAVALGFAAPKGSGADLTALALIASVLSGSSGRLAQDLHSQQIFPRAVIMQTEALLTAGTAYLFFETAPEDEARARAAVLARIESLARTGLSEKAMAEARTLAVLQQRARLQSQAQRAQEYILAAIFQREAVSVDAFAEQLEKLTPEEIKRVAATYLKPAMLYSGIVRGTSSASAPPKSN